MDQGAHCGQGRRSRYKRCLREGARHAVPDHLCAEALGPDTGEAEEDCSVPCPVDCVVSQWTEWTPCSATCGLGKSNEFWYSQKSISKVTEWVPKPNVNQNIYGVGEM